MAVVAVGVGIGLNQLDTHHAIKSKVIAGLKMLPEHTAQVTCPPPTVPA
ncbi:hypothetical protein M5C99_01120 [Acidovorax sp. NCPPB 2350]|nr:hypothetical protein M5C99_01120 [Acidovorax sp. NCPPB 2350]